MRSRRLIDVSRIDTSIRLLGVNWKTPIVLAPSRASGRSIPRVNCGRSRGTIEGAPADSLDQHHDFGRGRERGAR